MVDQTLLNYLEQVYALESDRYTIAQMIDRLKQESSLKRSQIQQEILQESYESTKTIDTSLNARERKWVNSGIEIMVFSLIIFFIIIKVASRPSKGIIWCIVFFIVGIILTKVGDSIRNSRVQGEEYLKDKASDNAQTQLNNVKKQNNEIRAICAKIEEKIKELDDIQAEKTRVLQQMYDCDIIHRSYRNFYGVSKIYHLLDTGICDSLTGVNGAYSQMRTDQIIDTQKISNQIQNELLATNRMMYDAVNRTNHLLGSMTQQMNIQNANNAQLLRDIRDNVQVSNFLIESGNNDRKAIAESAEYLAYAEKQRRLEQR